MPPSSLIVLPIASLAALAGQVTPALSGDVFGALNATNSAALERLGPDDFAGMSVGEIDGLDVYPLANQPLQLCAVEGGDCYEAFTNEQGQFVIQDVEAGQYVIETESRFGDIVGSELEIKDQSRTRLFIITE